MATDRVIVRYSFDPPAAVRVVIPVQEDRAEARHQSVGDVARALGGMLLVLGLECAEHRAAGAHDIHRVRALRQLLEGFLQRLGQAAQSLQLALVFLQLVPGRQLFVHQ